MKTLPAVARILLRLLFAALAIAISSIVLVPLRGFFSTSVVAVLYLLMVVLCTTIGGVIAGVAASILAFFTFNYLFLQPLNTFTVAHTQDIVAMFVFLTVAVVISNLMGQAQKRLEQIQVRERESMHLFELSSALTSIRDERQIAEILAQHLLVVFQANAVTVIIRGNDVVSENQDGSQIQVHLPDHPKSEDTYQQTQALTSTRGNLGEILLRTKTPSLTPNETRLLRTIASQAALAIERTLLSKTENRNRVLEESDRLKTAILSSVSHDFRTPLASILAAASSLYGPGSILEPEARLELQSLLLEEIERLNQLVGNLLDMSRIEAGALKLQKQWNSLSDLIDTAVDRMQRHVTRHTLEIDVSENLPLLRVDAILIEQVIINLVSNSVKYAPIGSPIVIRARVLDPESMEISLINKGPSIPTEHLEHIFSKYYHFPGMPQESSTGLGLSICKGIVEAHGGRIWALNSPEGLSFCFTLPIEKSEFSITQEDVTAHNEGEGQRETLG